MVALATMLLPLFAISATGVLAYRESVTGLQEFEEETVDESAAIEAARDLLEQADEVGEATAA